MTQNIRQLFADATHAHQGGKLEQAERLYRRILEQWPDNADALHMLGLACSQQERHPEAATWIEKAVAIQRNNAVFHNNLGEVYRRMDDWENAVASYRQALAIVPDFAEAHYNLANVLKMQEQDDEAITHYEHAVQLNPNHASAHFNLANALREQGNLDTAMEHYQHTTRLKPDHFKAYNNLAVVFKEQRRTDEAVEQLRRCIAINAAFPEAHRNLGTTLESQGKLDEARQSFQQACALEPNNDLMRLHAETMCPPVVMSNQEIDDYRANLHATLQHFASSPPRFDPHTLGSVGQPHFNLMYQGRFDRPVKEQWAALFAGVFPVPGQRAAPVGTGKPHIGFVVTHGHEGVFLKCMGGIVNHLSSERFRVTVVCSAKGGQKRLRETITNPHVSYLPITATSFDRAVEQVRQAHFDLLYHWHVGGDTTSYFLPFYDLAPVQVAAWGAQFTTGIPHIAYLTSAEGMETSESDTHYTETLVRFKRLPTCYTRPPVPNTIPSRSHFGLPDDRHIYLCHQNVRKVHPDMDTVFADILRRDPCGLLVFIEDAQHGLSTRLRQRLQTTMPEVDVIDQVRFMPRLPTPDYLALVASADVCLDTFHYTAGANTAYDAFAAGTPLVTLPGEYQRGRYTLAAYRQMGIDDGIADTPDAYVDLAVRLGTDPAERARLSAAIHEASPALFDDMEAVDELSDFFEYALGQAR